MQGEWEMEIECVPVCKGLCFAGGSPFSRTIKTKKTKSHCVGCWRAEKRFRWVSRNSLKSDLAN